MILNRNLNLSSVKVKQKYYLSVLSKKKKKPTDRPNPKTMGRVTANKLFIKDGPGYIFGVIQSQIASKRTFLCARENTDNAV